MTAGAADPHHAALEWLTQRVQQMAWIFGELVEEQHAVVGERQLAGSRQTAATHETGAGQRVMRGAERAAPHQAATRSAQSRGRVQPCDHERLLRRERRQDARQPSREHGFPRSGRPDQ